MTILQRLLLPIGTILMAPAVLGAAEEPSPFVTHLDLAVQVTGSESEEARAALENLGDAALVEGRFGEAESLYHRVGQIRLGPRTADLRFRWSLLYFRTGRNKEAQQMLRAADLLLESRHPLLKTLVRLHERAAALVARQPPVGDRGLHVARQQELAREIEAESSQLLLYATLDSWQRMAELARRRGDRDNALRFARLANESYSGWQRWTPEGARRYLEHLELHFELAWTDPGPPTDVEARVFEETFALAQRLQWAPELKAIVEEAAAAEAAQEPLPDITEERERMAQDRLAALAELDALRAELAETERLAPSVADPAQQRRRAQGLRADVEFVRQRLTAIEERLRITNGRDKFSAEPAATSIATIREHLESNEALVYALKISERNYYWVVRPGSTRRHRSGLRIEPPPLGPGRRPSHSSSIDGIFGEARRLLAVGVSWVLPWSSEFMTVKLPSLAALSTPREILFPAVPARPESERRPRVASGSAVGEHIEHLLRIYRVDEAMQEAVRRQLTEAFQALGTQEGIEQLASFLQGYGHRVEGGSEWLDIDAPRNPQANLAPIEVLPGELPAVLPERIVEVLGGSDVRSVAFHPGGSMVTGDANGFLRLWDAQGREKYQQKTQAGVLDLAFSPDGRFLAAATTRVWRMNVLADASGRQELPWTDPVSGAAMSLTLLSVSSRSVGWGGGGSYLLSAEARPVGVFGMGVQENRDVAPIRRLEVESGASHYFIGHRYPTQLAVSNDGRWIVTSYQDDSLGWWDPVSGEEVVSISAAHKGVTDLAWSADGRYLASSGEDGLVKVWRAAERRVMMRLRHSHEAVTAVAWSDDGKALASAGQNGTTILWNLNDGEATHRLTGSDKQSDGVAILDIAFAPNSGQVVGAGSGGRIYLWRIDS